MGTLNEIVKKYLKTNGITVNFFANYINCEQSACSRWLSGQKKLKPDQIKKTHDFLQGKFLKPVEEIMKEK